MQPRKREWPKKALTQTSLLKSSQGDFTGSAIKTRLSPGSTLSTSASTTTWYTSRSLQTLAHSTWEKFTYFARSLKSLWTISNTRTTRSTTTPHSITPSKATLHSSWAPLWSSCSKSRLTTLGVLSAPTITSLSLTATLQWVTAPTVALTYTAFKASSLPWPLDGMNTQPSMSRSINTLRKLRMEI